jgi:hypothetical protein
VAGAYGQETYHLRVLIVLNLGESRFWNRQGLNKSLKGFRLSLQFIFIIIIIIIVVGPGCVVQNSA